MKERTRMARRLRRDATEAERLLWPALRGSFRATRFRRQHPIGGYVVDFACAAHNLAIAIDGGQHVSNKQADLLQTGELPRPGHRVLRFWNNEVLENLPGVLQAIQQELADGLTLSAPQGGEGGAHRAAMGG